MPYIEHYKEIILADDSLSDESRASIREIHSVLYLQDCSNYDYCIALDTLLPYMPIIKELAPAYQQVWQNWTTAIKEVRTVIQESIEAKSGCGDANMHTEKSIFDAFPKSRYLVNSLKAELNLGHTGLLAAKAAMVIGHYIVIIDGALRNGELRFATVSQNIHSCCNKKKSVYRGRAKEYLPEWPSQSINCWIEMFFENIKNLPKDESYTDRNGYHKDDFHFIRSICTILKYVNRERTDSPHNPTNTLQFLQEKDSSVIFKPKRRQFFNRSGVARHTRPPFIFFQEAQLRNDVNSNTDCLAPNSIYVEPQPDTPADQTLQLATVEFLEVRYSNYRTAMENQRLPWAWDCINHVEIKALQAALLDISQREGATNSEKQGALFVWLLLVTGQTLEQILSFALTRTSDSQNALLHGPMYLRSIIPPMHSFQPKSDIQSYLSSNATSIELMLHAPAPMLCRELGLIDGNIALFQPKMNIGKFLDLDLHRGEQVLRDFLGGHRTRNLRLLPGRIRNVLSTEIMRITNDPVATHLLTSLPTDMPPSGIYYTAYSPARLKSIYAEAMAKIFSTNK